ncbi:hypothetical protein D9M68_929620 [compost metagenome]
MGFAPGQNGAIKRQRRIGVGILRCYVQHRIVRLDRQPGCAGAEAVGRFALFPWYGRAAAIAPFVFRPEANAARVGQFLKQ